MGIYIYIKIKYHIYIYNYIILYHRLYNYIYISYFFGAPNFCTQLRQQKNLVPLHALHPTVVFFISTSAELRKIPITEDLKFHLFQGHKDSIEFRGQGLSNPKVLTILIRPKKSQMCPKNPGFPQTNPMTWGSVNLDHQSYDFSGGVWILREVTVTPRSP